MADNRFYMELYRILDGVSPLRFDCGRLCGKACCGVDQELPGMFLFPGEETLFAGKPEYTVSTAELPGYGQAALLSCAGVCERAERPLACRVFPLAPMMGEDGVSVRLDPRGRRVCPLCRGEIAALSAGFAEGTHLVFERLAGDPGSAGFLRALSRHLDEFGKPL